MSYLQITRIHYLSKQLLHAKMQAFSPNFLVATLIKENFPYIFRGSTWKSAETLRLQKKFLIRKLGENARILCRAVLVAL